MSQEFEKIYPFIKDVIIKLKERKIIFIKHTGECKISGHFTEKRAEAFFKENEIFSSFKNKFPTLKELLYCYYHDIIETPTCPVCGKPRKFSNSNGVFEYLNSRGSKKCTNQLKRNFQKAFLRIKDQKSKKKRKEVS